MNTSILKPTQWGLIFTLLSMDIMNSMHEFMGLQLKEKEHFIQLLRHIIIINRKNYEANPSEIPPLADRVIEMLESSFGKIQTKHFYNWATSVFTEVHTDNPQWSAWEILFLQWAYSSTPQNNLKLPLERCNMLLSNYLKELNINDVEQKINELKSQVLSNWDLEMYSIHQFDNDDEINDPFNTVVKTIEINRFQLFWESLLPQLSASEKICLQKQGQLLLNELGVWMSAPLKYPDELRRLL